MNDKKHQQSPKTSDKLDITFWQLINKRLIFLMHEGLLKTENLKTTYSNTGKISKKMNEQFTQKLIQLDFKHGKQ